MRACLCLGPEVWVVGAVHDVEYGGHLDAGRGAHLLKQRLQVEPPAYFWTRLWFYLYLWCKDNAVRKIVTLRSRSWSQSWAQDWVRSRGRREILLKEPRPPGCVEDEQARIFIKEDGTWWVQCMIRLDDQTWWAHWMIRLSMVIFNLLSTSLPSLSRTFYAAKVFLDIWCARNIK